MGLQLAHLRTLLMAEDFDTGNAVVSALAPPDGPLATIFRDGRIVLDGILCLGADECSGTPK